MIALRLTGSRCRCAQCRGSFNSVSVFDSHRKGNFEECGAERRCLTVLEMRAKGWRVNARGFWIERSRCDMAHRSGDRIEVDTVVGLV